MKRGALLLVIGMAVAGCGAIEFRLDESQGIPAIKGTAEISLANYTCGGSIAAGKYMVTTKATATGCEFSFDDTVEVLKASDYADKAYLSSSAKFVQKVELEINKLDLLGDGTKLDLSARVTNMTLNINGQQLADKATLTGTLPKTVSITGQALKDITSKVEGKQAVTVTARVVVELPNSPPPPMVLKIDYDSQPAIVVGPGKLF